MKRVLLALALIGGALAFAPAAHASTLEDWFMGLLGYGSGSGSMDPARMSCGDGDGSC